ncbi:MAG TPA: hypothetical protein EYG39_06405 [Rhodothermales bacterium]|nr:hypothetical protein [Rhodothermales bacterium]
MRRLSSSSVVLFALAVLSACSTLSVESAFSSAAREAEAPAPPLEQVWRVNADAGFGAAAPAVFTDGRVLVGTRDGGVLVIDGRTGETVGKGDVGDAIDGRLEAMGPLVFVPVTKGREGLVAFDAVRSAKRWGVRGTEHVGGAKLSGGVLVAAAHDGTVRGIEPQTGRELWAERMGETAQVHASVVLAGDLAIVADTDGWVRAFDPQTGAVRWDAHVGAPVYRTPAASGALAVFPTTRGALVALDATTGAERWRVESAAGVRWATPALGGGRVFAGGTDGRLLAIDAGTGEVRWARPFDGVIAAAPLSAGGLVYVGTYRNELVALDAETGAEQWRHELPGRVRSGLVGAGGTLVVLAEPRYIYGFRPTASASR